MRITMESDKWLKPGRKNGMIHINFKYQSENAQESLVF